MGREGGDEAGAVAVVAADSSGTAQHARREARQPPSVRAAARWQDNIANSPSAQRSSVTEPVSILYLVYTWYLYVPCRRTTKHVPGIKYKRVNN